MKTRGRHNFGRPNLGDLLMSRAMEPALDRHAAEVEARVGQLLDRTIDQFNRGGV